MGIFLVSCVSAGDLNETVISQIDDEVIGVEEINQTQEELGAAEIVESEDSEMLSVNYTPKDSGEIQGSVDNASSGDTIILDGYYLLDSTINVNKQLNFVGKNDATVDGNSTVRLFTLSANGITFKDITFKNGKSSDKGGAIYSSNREYTVVDCKFINNSAHDGGAIYGKYREYTVVDCKFINNSAYNGGAMCGSSSAVNCSFVGNSAKDYGGAMQEGSAVNCSFVNNLALDGGAICWGSAGNCSFVNNSARNTCGAMKGGSAVNCSFVGNSAGMYGGAMSDGSAVNCSFFGNSADSGGAMRSGSAVNCSFVGNSAGMYGGAMRDGSAVNCSFVNNSAGWYGGAMRSGSAVNCTFNQSDVDFLSGTSDILDCIFEHYPNVEYHYTSYLKVDDLRIIKGKTSFLVAYLYDVRGPLVNKTVIYNIEGNNYTVVTNSSGFAKVKITDYITESGYYNVSISYAGDDINYAVSKNVSVLIKFDPIINVDNITLFVGEEGYLVVNLYYSDEKFFNKTVTFTINDVEYNQTTDLNGTVKFKISDYVTAYGTYDIAVSFGGDDYFNPVSAIARVIINRYDSILSFDNVSVNLDDDKFISVKLSNARGALFNQIITFNINGVEEKRTTLPDGTARLDINEYFTEVGKYQVGVSFAGNDLNNPSSEVVNVQINFYKGNLTVVQNGKYYNDTFLTFKLVNMKDNEGISNAHIRVMLFNGEIINLTTDSMGMAEFKANFSPGTYYLNASVTDENVNVNKIESKDFIINEIIGIIELRQEGVGFNKSTLIAKLYNQNNGDVYRNIEVELEFPIGKPYSVFTNDDGIAVYHIPFTPGDYYVLAKVADHEFVHFNTTFKDDIHIEKSDADIIFTNEIIFAYGGVGYTNVTVIGGRVFEENISVVNHSDIVPRLKGNVISVTGLGMGHYLLNVTVTPDENHLSISKLLNITVLKTASAVSFDDVVFDYEGVGYTDVTVSGGIVLKENITVVESDKAVIDLVGNTISVSNLSVGNYTLKVITTPDEDHSSVTNYAHIRVNKIDSSVSFPDVVFDYGGVGYTDVTVIGGSVIKKNISVVESDKAVIDLVGNTISVSNLSAGNYTLKVITTPDGNHSSVTNYAHIRVNKIDSSVSFSDVVFDYGGVGYTTLTVVGGGVKNITVLNHKEAVIKWDDNYKVTIYNLTAGPYTLQVTTDPDSNHKSFVGEGKIIVNKIYSSFTYDNDILFTYGGSGSTKITVTGGRLVESKIKVLNHNAKIKLRGNIVTVSNLDVGNYYLIVPVVPDENHLEWSDTIPITVVKSSPVKEESQIILGDPIVFYYGGSGYTTVKVIDGTVSESKIKVDGQPKAKIKLEGNRIVVSGLKVGSYNLRVTSIPYSGYISVVEHLKITVKKIPAKISAKKISVYYKSKDKFKIKLINTKTKKGIGNMVVKIKVYNGKKSKVYKLKTNSKGIGSFASSKLSVGKHKVVLSMSKYGYRCKSVTSSVMIKKIPAKIKVKKISTVYKKGKVWKIKLLNPKNKGVGKTTVKLKIYNGKKSVTKKVKTNSKGVAKFRVSSKMSLGKHKVVLTMSKNKYYAGKSVTSYITVNPIKLSIEVTSKYQKYGSMVSVWVKNKKAPVNNLKIKLLVYSGKKFKPFYLVTGNYKNYKGFAGFGTNAFSFGKHKVIVKPVSKIYSGYGKTTMVIQKGADKYRLGYSLVSKGKLKTYKI